MKRLFLSLALLASLSATAQQDMAYKIPQEAGAVVTLSGNKLLELLSASEFNNSAIGKKMIKELSRKNREGKIAGIEDLGINLGANAYYYYVQTDSISYHGLLLPLNDAAKFERLFDKDQEITRNGATRQMVSNSDKAYMTWNNTEASLVFGDLKRNYFDDSTVAARYGIKDEAYNGYNNTYPVMADTIVADVAAAADAVDSAVAADYAVATPAYEQDAAADVAVAAPARTEDEEPVEKTSTMEPPAYEDIPIDAPPPPMVQVVEAPPVGYTQERVSEEETHRNKVYNDNWEIRQNLARTWAGAFANGVFNRQPGAPSILGKKEFVAAQDKEASATLYLADIGNLYRGIFSYFSYRYFGRTFAGFKGMNAQLYLGKEQMRMTSEMMVDEKKAASYKKLYSHKLNSKFAKYVNSDKLIGFLSYSFDTEEYLKELPAMLNYAYGGYMQKYTEELDIASELLSIMLDEKAIAKVIKGDALFLVTDIAQKEYTYKTYEYNDDWEKKEVQRTRKETLPEFLLMVSSDDSYIIKRLLNDGMHKGVVKEKAGIYSLDRDVTKSPMDIHLLIKDGIVFCGTSYKDIENISLDRFQGNISKEHKKLMTKNNMTAFFDPNKLAGKIPREEFNSTRKLNMFNQWMTSTGKFYGRTTGIKGDRISGELIAEVPQGKENALKYFFSLIESASKND